MEIHSDIVYSSDIFDWNIIHVHVHCFRWKHYDFEAEQ